MRTLFRWPFRSAAVRGLTAGPAGFRISPDVASSVHANGIVWMDRKRGTVFSANRVGAMIWSAAAGHRGLDCVAKSISDEFHIPVETAERDAAEFLAQLAAQGILLADIN